MLELLKKLEEAEAATNKLEILMIENVENDFYEEEFDKAYEKEHAVLMECAREIVKITSGKVDEITARLMLRDRRGYIKALFSRAMVYET